MQLFIELNMFSEPRADALVTPHTLSGLRVTTYVTGMGVDQNPKKAFRNVSFHVVILEPGWKYERKPADNGPN